MVKLLPNIASCTVPEALTRQEPPGKVAGKKTLNPRLALTWAQSVMVVGVGATGVLVATGVPPLVFAPGVVVGEAVTLACGVAVAGVTVDAAPSSRKSIKTFPHQR